MNIRSGTDPRPMRLTLRVLAHLLDYPGEELPDRLTALVEALDAEEVLSATRRAELDVFLAQFAAQVPLDAAAAWIELFDRGRATSLHLFEHVHGDSRDRGPALLDLAQTYAAAGLDLRADELPDYLPAVLEFASTLPPVEGRAFLAETVHILTAIFSALRARGSTYACLLGALIELAGAEAQAVGVPAEEPLDAAWEEPPAFGGCPARSHAHQASSQPVHFVRRSTALPGGLA